MRLDINYKGKKAVKHTHTWRLNNMFLNKEQVTEEIKNEIKRLPERDVNENKTTQNQWDATKSVPRAKFIAIQSYLKIQVQFSSVLQSFTTICEPMDFSTSGFPIHHQLLEIAQTHVH